MVYSSIHRRTAALCAVVLLTQCFSPAAAGVIGQDDTVLRSLISSTSLTLHTARLTVTHAINLAFLVPLHVTSVAVDSGSTYPWEGRVPQAGTGGNTNTGNGNQLTPIPLVSWTALGQWI